MILRVDNHPIFTMKEIKRRKFKNPEIKILSNTKKPKLKPEIRIVKEHSHSPAILKKNNLSIFVLFKNKSRIGNFIDKSFIGVGAEKDLPVQKTISIPGKHILFIDKANKRIKLVGKSEQGWINVDKI